MNNIQKFKEIKDEMDKNFISMTWIRKKELSKKLEKIRVFKPFIYFSLIVGTFFIVIVFYFFPLLKLTSPLISVFLYLLFFPVVYYLFKNLFEASNFKNFYSTDYKIIKNRLLLNTKELEENFYNKLDAEACESLSDKIYQSLIKDYSLPEDMTSIFVKDLKNFMKEYRFEDNEPLKKEQDESHASTRYANSKK